MHRRAGGRGSERTGTACIPFSNPLSRRSLWALSCALSFASLCHSYMCACLFGGNSHGDYFLGCKRAVFISNDRRGRGRGRKKKLKREKRKEKGEKKTEKEEKPARTRVNVQETLFQIQIPLGFTSESPQRCQRPLTSHFRAGGGVGVEAEVPGSGRLCSPERRVPGVATLAAAARS